MRVVGLDASSSTIGYSIIDFENEIPKLIFCDYIKPPKKGNIFERLSETQRLITLILNKFKPDIVGIEDIAKFMQGKSTASTILILAVFNRSVGLACYNFLGYPPILFNVLKIRHGLKFNKEIPKKEEIPDIVSKHLNIKFPYVVKNGKVIDENLDIADSIAVALFTGKRIFNLEKEIKKQDPNKKPTKKFKLLLQEYKEITGKDGA